VKKGWQLC